MKLLERSLNSIEIQSYSPEKQLAYIKQSDLSNLQSFSKKSLNGKVYVIAENLTVSNSFND